MWMLYGSHCIRKCFHVTKLYSSFQRNKRDQFITNWNVWPETMIVIVHNCYHLPKRLRYFMVFYRNFSRTAYINQKKNSKSFQLFYIKAEFYTATILSMTDIFSVLHTVHLPFLYIFAYIWDTYILAAQIVT